MSDISIRAVKKSYGKMQVVHGVDLDIHDGEFIVILGPSGCGKSTLLRMIAGLETITGGEIAIDGRVVNRLEPRERGCAMVFQNYALYPHMTVYENIGYALKVAGINRANRDARIKEVAATLGLEDMLSRKPGQLSGGQRQRVAMGRAMIREPKVFLYDEPLSNLDAKLRVSMRIEIRKLHQRIGATSIFVTHDQVEALTLADRIVVMNKGTIEQVGTPREVYQKPGSTYVGGFIGTPGMCFLDGEVSRARGGIRLNDDQFLPLDPLRFAHVTDGKITVGLRAENLRVAAPGEGVRARFEFAEEMGSGQTVHCTVADGTVIAHSKEVVAVSHGSDLWLDVAARDVHLFDAATGRSVIGQ